MSAILLYLFPLPHLGISGFVFDSGECTAIQNPLFCGFSNLLRDVFRSAECSITGLAIPSPSTMGNDLQRTTKDAFFWVVISKSVNLWLEHNRKSRSHPQV